MTTATRTIIGASISTERLTGRFHDERDIRVTVTISSLADVVLEKPVTFYADIKLAARYDDFDYFDCNLYSAGPDWCYDDDADRVRYFYSAEDSVLVSETLPDEVEETIREFIFVAQRDAGRAYEEALDRALGI